MYKSKKKGNKKEKKTKGRGEKRRKKGKKKTHLVEGHLVRYASGVPGASGAGLAQLSGGEAPPGQATLLLLVLNAAAASSSSSRSSLLFLGSGLSTGSLRSGAPCSFGFLGPTTAAARRHRTTAVVGPFVVVDVVLNLGTATRHMRHKAPVVIIFLSSVLTPMQWEFFQSLCNTRLPKILGLI